MLEFFVKYFVLGAEKRDDEGATAVEYGLLVALIAAVIIATVVTLGGQIQDAFQTIVNQM